ncbi:MAG: hypothetical protein ACOVSR_08860 [Bacteroidia bacterium]
MNKKIDFKKARTAHFRLGALSCWEFYSLVGLGWFRLFGVGLHWKDTSRHRMYFCERNGYKKGLKIGSWRISLLSCNGSGVYEVGAFNAQMFIPPQKFNRSTKAESLIISPNLINTLLAVVAVFQG